jgi:Flp pilus assembly protein TadG
MQEMLSMIKLKPMLPRFAHNKRGVAAIEAALLLPLFLFFVFGLIDVSWTMLRRYSVEQAGAQLAVRMRENPTANVASLAGSLGYGLVDFTGTSACMCVTQHATLNAAASNSANRGCPCTSNNTGPDTTVPVPPDFFLGVSAAASFAPLSFVGRQFFGNTIDYRFHAVLAFERMPRTCYVIESYSTEYPLGDPKAGSSHVGCEDGFFLTGVSTSKGTSERPFKQVVGSPNPNPGAGATHLSCEEAGLTHLAGLQFQNGTRFVEDVPQCYGDPTKLYAPHVMNFQGRCTVNRYHYTCCSYDRETTRSFETPPEKW